MKSIVSSNPFVSVSLKPIVSLTGLESSPACANAILSNNKIVNVVSDNYGLLPNSAYFSVIEKHLLDSGFAFDIVYKNFNDKVFTADYIFKDSKFTLESVKGYRDSLKPKLRFVNSYDGSCKTAGYMSFFREVCSNGLHGIVEDIGFSLKHRGSIVELVLPNIKEMIDTYTKSDGIKIIRRFNTLAERQVSDLREFTKSICEKTGIFKYESSEKNPEPSKHARIVLDIVAKEADLFKTVPNAWLVYNAFNEWLNDDKLNSKNPAIRQKLDASLIQQIELAVN